MRELKLTLEPFWTVDVVSCHIHKTLNDHATLQFSGHIPGEAEEHYMRAGQSEVQVKLLAVDEKGTSYTLFCGATRAVQVQHECNLCLLSVDAVSGSYYLDLLPQTRVFQNPKTTYDAILKHNEQSYGNAGHAMMVGSGTAIGNLLVQYQETDWEFAKRLASHFGECLLPVYQQEGIHFYFGIPEGRRNEALSKETYILRKDADDYWAKLRNGVSSVIEADSATLEMQSREIYEICDTVSFRNQTYYIYEIDSVLTGREILHSYRLKSRAGLKIAHQYNEKMIGASLNATIAGVSKDTVQVQVAVDGIQDGRKWFPYSTVYSSPDGTGWYCMPEKGDSVRLYLPSTREKDGYIISAVHLSKNCGQSRSTPDNKSLKSKYNKEVLFEPGRLKLTNNKGMSVTLIDSEGIVIHSDKAVTITSGESITITSTQDSINASAAESIMLTQSGDSCPEGVDAVSSAAPAPGPTASITMENDIKLTGKKVYIS